MNIGVSGPGVVCGALRRRLAMEEHLTLGDLAEEIKITSFRVTRVGELIGREVAAELGVAFGSSIVAGPDPDRGRQRGRDSQNPRNRRYRARVNGCRGHA